MRAEDFIFGSFYFNQLINIKIVMYSLSGVISATYLFFEFNQVACLDNYKCKSHRSSWVTSGEDLRMALEDGYFFEW